MIAWTITPIETKRRDYTITLPYFKHRKMEVIHLLFSPDGTRLAWLVEYTDKPAVWSSCLLVSNVEGGNPHYVGVWRDQDPVWEFGWLPDGKHLSFISQDALYTVSAD